ncbi:MAG: Rid family detoxifying hydrolase, partial [Ginsengibacter sp.]
TLIFKFMKSINHPERESNFVTGAFSDGIIVDNFLFVSGQASVNFKTSKFVLGTIEEETERTMENIKALVESAGASMSDIVKCTVYLKDINDFDRYNKVYARYFPLIKPSRTTVETGLGKNIKVEIDCIARIPS